MSQDSTPQELNPSLHPRTRAIHHGIRRSQYGEMAEALFMTQAFPMTAPNRPKPAF